MDKIEVTQKVREAAFDAYMTCFETVPNDLWLQALLDGKHDSDEMAQAFARFERDILATRTDATPVAWMPMESTPEDEPILAAIKVNHKNGKSWWERHIILIDSETGTISDMDFHHGWEAEDYECWQPLPAAPNATNTHPPATDVAALVEALVAHNDALRSASQVAYRDGKDTNWLTFRGAITYTLAEHHDTVNAARQALAPFTKGQP